MTDWRPIDRAPQDGRWIIAIHRDVPDRRAVIRWDPGRAGDGRPWHVATTEYGYAPDAFTHWIPFPELPEPGREAGWPPGTAE